MKITPAAIDGDIEVDMKEVVGVDIERGILYLSIYGDIRRFSVSRKEAREIARVYNISSSIEEGEYVICNEERVGKVTGVGSEGEYRYIISFSEDDNILESRLNIRKVDIYEKGTEVRLVDGSEVKIVGYDYYSKAEEIVYFVEHWENTQKISSICFAGNIGEVIR